MLPEWFVVYAVALRLTSGLSYALAVIKKRAKPNPITWFFWALTPAIVFVAQLFEHAALSSMAITLALGFGPLLVFILSLKYSLQRTHFTPASITCGVVAAIGVALWLTTSDPKLAIIFSIGADICSSIPTIIKIWRKPGSEFLPAYAITMASMVITLLTLQAWDFASFIFPVYILAINAVIFGTGFVATRRKPARRARRLTSARR